MPPPSDDALGLLEPSLLRESRGGKGRALEPLFVEVVRELGEEDLPKLLAPPPTGIGSGGVLAIRSAHHTLAQQLAEGVSLNDISLLTGYSPSWISNLQKTPAFAELVEHYIAIRTVVFVDAQERMKALGLASLEELQSRLASEPEGWTKRELMDLAKMMLVDGQSRQTTGGGPAAPTISVSFVSPSGSVTIDHQAGG